VKIMVSAGEVSGDVHGSYLVRALLKLRPDLLFFGLGSERLAAAGVDVRYDIVNRGSIGLIEALPNIVPLFSVFARVKKLVLKERPDLVILIDSQGFNLPLAKFCRANKIKTVYYISPQEWLWGTPRGVKHLARLIDLIVAIFPREYETYKLAGANVIYEGHPLIDIVPRPSSLAPRSPMISLCPGSRTHELKSMLPILLRAAELIREELPSVTFIIPAASQAVRAAIKAPFEVVVDQTYELLARSQLAICTSGTINFEAALLGVPNIMAYRLSPLTYLVGKYLLRIDRKIKYFCMPNILLDRPVIPELIMSSAEPNIIAREALRLLRDDRRQTAMLSAFSELRRSLGAPGVIDRLAVGILNRF
jgi:lipid-A-disaccharide synthase